MVSGMFAAGWNYPRPASTINSRPIVPQANVVQAPATTDASTGNSGIKVTDLKPLLGMAKPISVADDPSLRDMLATNWLIMQNANATPTTPADNAPENVYAEVKVSGKVVATLYNGGSSWMTNQAAAGVGDLEDPPSLGGPDLAQWRAENYAKRLGGTIEKAPTAISQSQWTPRESSPTTFSREQLDAAFQSMMAEGQKAIAQRQSSYLASRPQAGTNANLSA